jgi:hypothetical protein
MQLSVAPSFDSSSTCHPPLTTHVENYLILAAHLFSQFDSQFDSQFTKVYLKIFNERCIEVKVRVPHPQHHDTRR